MLSKIDSLQSLIEEKDFTKAFEIAQNLSQIYVGDLYISLLEAIKQKDIQKALQI